MTEMLATLVCPSDSPPPPELCSTSLSLCWSLLALLLSRFLIQRSSGIPYYCEELLRSLHRSDMLLSRTQRRGEKGEDNWESLIGKHLRR